MIGLFKKKGVRLTNRAEFEKILNEMVKQLSKNGSTAQAQVTKKLINALVAQDDAAFSRILLSVDMWGGSGAVWEVGGFESPSEEAAFQKSIIALTDAMKDSGIRCRGAYQVAKLFRRELTRSRGVNGPQQGA